MARRGVSARASGQSPLQAFVKKTASTNDPLPGGVTVLDGSMAGELERHGVDMSTRLWSAIALRCAPDAIEAVHTSYLRAGAAILTTNSYQATVPGFASLGLSEQEASELIATSATLARRAICLWRAAHPGPRLWVAGSIGPYGAYLADGSEYRGDYALSPADYRDFHRPRIAALARGGVDLFAVETQPKLDEAGAIVELMAREFPGIWAWVSFSLRDGRTLADGTPLTAAARWACRQPNLLAVGINCVPPRIVEQALGVLAAGTDLPLICYPNSGESYDPSTKSWHTGGEHPGIAEFVPSWRRAGARIIGGCCRTTPHDIAEIAHRLRAEG